jgi:hypothetical protein
MDGIATDSVAGPQGIQGPAGTGGDGRISLALNTPLTSTSTAIFSGATTPNSVSLIRFDVAVKPTVANTNILWSFTQVGGNGACNIMSNTIGTAIVAGGIATIPLPIANVTYPMTMTCAVEAGIAAGTWAFNLSTAVGVPLNAASVLKGSWYILNKGN